ncbi:hypothetical protein MKX01_034479, partial [Papaver californicum]
TYTNDDSSEEGDGNIVVQVVDDGEGRADLETDNESKTYGSEVEKGDTDDYEKEG